MLLVAQFDIVPPYHGFLPRLFALHTIQSPWKIVGDKLPDGDRRPPLVLAPHRVGGYEELMGPI